MEQCYEVLKKSLKDSEGVIEADLNFFYPEATGDKVAAVKQLVVTFGTDEDPALQKISFKN